ncbi:MAG TPA: hypothetical protein VGX78_11970 [Pirellulales bacterium]|nr:hypothetical protein [Pirellulales bacterium]
MGYVRGAATAKLAGAGSLLRVRQRCFTYRFLGYVNQHMRPLPGSLSTPTE